MFKNLIFTLTILLGPLSALADNEMKPFANLPDLAVCDSVKIDPTGRPVPVVMELEIKVSNRDQENQYVQVKSADKSIDYKIGDGFLGRAHQHEAATCGFVTTKNVTYYICDLVDGKKPTFLDVVSRRGMGLVSMISPDRICAGSKCLGLKNCR